jgi:hypothetical protein
LKPNIGIRPIDRVVMAAPMAEPPAWKTAQRFLVEYQRERRMDGGGIDQDKCARRDDHRIVSHG